MHRRRVRVAAFARSCHPLPTLAVTLVITAFAWSVGWRLPGIATLMAAVAVGQLSVGWGNDAHDARLDASAGRRMKPTVSGAVTPRALWIAAVCALVLSMVLSWTAAGVLGGSFHVFSLAMAWFYNAVLSRTTWSWLPYALAFGAVPPFVTYGLDGSPPAAWMVAAFAIIGVSAHLANALPDIDTDREVGLDGLAVRLGARGSRLACWVLLAVGTTLLAVVTFGARPMLAGIAIMTYLLAMAVSLRSRRGSADFHALIVVVVVDVAVLVVAAGSAG